MYILVHWIVRGYLQESIQVTKLESKYGMPWNSRRYPCKIRWLNHKTDHENPLREAAKKTFWAKATGEGFRSYVHETGLKILAWSPLFWFIVGLDFKSWQQEPRASSSRYRDGLLSMFKARDSSFAGNRRIYTNDQQGNSWLNNRSH